MADNRSTQRAWSSTLPPRMSRLTAAESALVSKAAALSIDTTTRRGTGKAERSVPGPSHGSSRRCVSASLMPRAPPTPGNSWARATAFATSASMATPSSGLISMVTSRPMSDAQASAARSITDTTAMVKPARKVMMAMTSTSVRPAIACGGTIGEATAMSPPGLALGAEAARLGLGIDVFIRRSRGGRSR